MNNEPIYIPDAGQEREALTAWRLFTGPSPGQWMDNAGIPWPAAWCLLRVTKPPKLPGDDDAIFAGDIDVLAGRLVSESTLCGMSKQDRRRWAFRHAADGHCFFSPEGDRPIFDLSYLVGMEVKVAYVGVELRDGLNWPTLCSLKDSESKHRKLRRQLQSLLELGLDKVFLLDAVGGIPSQSTLSISAVDAEHRRLCEGFASDLPVGHIKMIMSAIRGHTEDDAGSFHFGPRRDAPENPRLCQDAVRARKGRLTQHVRDILAATQFAAKIPIVLDLCPRCGSFGPYHALTCPS